MDHMRTYSDEYFDIFALLITEIIFLASDCSKFKKNVHEP